MLAISSGLSSGVAIAFVGIGALIEPTAAADTSHFGRAPTSAETAAWNIDVTPSGAGLPPGSGNVARGKVVYLQSCSGCHGATGDEGPRNRLVGGIGTLTSAHPIKTVGSYWPYATTVFDYINRAMPYTAPGSLPPNDVYSVVAWLLFRNGILSPTATLNRISLPKVKMPNRDGFVPISVFDLEMSAGK